MIIVGGKVPNGVTDAVEIIGNQKCKIPKLPTGIGQHSLILTEDNKILVCGGVEANEKACLELRDRQWIQHSKLSSIRNLASAVVLSGNRTAFPGTLCPGTGQTSPKISCFRTNCPSTTYQLCIFRENISSWRKGNFFIN